MKLFGRGNKRKWGTKCNRFFRWGTRDKGLQEQNKATNRTLDREREQSKNFISVRGKTGEINIKAPLSLREFGAPSYLNLKFEKF